MKGIKTIIMAGGKGTRMASVNTQLPKPMLPIFDKPILEYQIECLKKQGLLDIILVIGYMGHMIRDYFGDGHGISPSSGQPFGVNIQYMEETEPLGTAGALYLLKNVLVNDFLLINGDIIFDVNVERFFQFHRKKGGAATLFTHPNNHPYDSGIVVSDDMGCVRNWLHKEDKRVWYQNRVNAGLHMLSPRIFQLSAQRHVLTEVKKTDLDREVLKPLISDSELYAYDSPEYVKDMGTPERFIAAADDIQKGRAAAKNLFCKQKAIFLDRDGTINEHNGFLNNIDDFKLLDGVAKAIRIINQSGYLAIVVTNQPVIARGEVSFKELEEIHNKMETLLGQEGAFVDHIYFCPHHPHKGFEGERPEYKQDCQCRKPKPGMLLEAAAQYNIDLSESWMIGDSQNDMEAGRTAGCSLAYIGEDVYLEGTLTGSSLLECVGHILTLSDTHGKVV